MTKAKQATAKLLARNKPVPHATSRRRAQAIIADAERYDEDTRRALQLSLERDSPDELAGMVKRAEAGETICDLTDPALQTQPNNRAAQFRRIAEHVTAILQNPLTPEALYLGIVDGLMKLDSNISAHESVGYVETILLVNDTSRQERKIS
jgi:phage gp29-like protein